MDTIINIAMFALQALGQAVLIALSLRWISQIRKAIRSHLRAKNPTH